MYTCCILLILLLRFYVFLSVLYFFHNYGNPLQVVTMDFKRALCLAVLSCFYKQKFRTWHTTYGTFASLGSLGIHLAFFVSSISCLCQCFATNLPLIFQFPYLHHIIPISSPFLPIDFFRQFCVVNDTFCIDLPIDNVKCYNLNVICLLSKSLNASSVTISWQFFLLGNNWNK